MSKLVSEVAFSSSINEPQATSIMCLECKSTEILFDPEMGEQVCGKCGIVLAEKLVIGYNNRMWTNEDLYMSPQSKEKPQFIHSLNQ
jgi:ribosomal protein S27E